MVSFAEYTKKKKKEQEDITQGITFDAYTRNILGDSYVEPDIAPVRGTVSSRDTSATEKDVKREEEKIKKEKEKGSWFQKGAFSDGYQFGDVGKTAFASGKEMTEKVTAGIYGMGEKVVDTGATLIGGVGGLLGADNFKNSMREFVEKDLYDEEELAKKFTLGSAHLNVASAILGREKLDKFTEDNSIWGEKAESLGQSAGQLGATIALQAVGVPWWLTTGATSFGSEVETAFKEDATYGEAVGSALITAGADILTEKLSGGIKFGGKTLDDVLLKPLTEKITDKAVKTLVNLGIDAVGEGAEEVIAGVISNLGTSLYKEESIGELVASEEALDEYVESFIGGAVLGGGVSGVNTVVEAKKESKQPKLTENEQKVADSVAESRIAEAEADGKKLTAKEKTEIRQGVQTELKKGFIDIGTIESTLGGETYNQYKTMTDEETLLEDKIKSLENAKTISERKQLVEAKEQLEALQKDTERTQRKSQLEEQLHTEVDELTANDTFLRESYNERTRKGQSFEADIEQYTGKGKEVVQKAIDSGKMNNTRRTHDFVDFLAKVSTDKGVDFDFTNNEELQKLGLALEGKTVNGYVEGNKIALNLQSNKALNKVVGHEVTHLFEGTDAHTELVQAVKQYAETKGEWQSRYEALSKLYEGVENVNIENELTADIIGDYLFTDSDFVNKLSTEKPNIFKKIYEEIKYLFKVATSGSKEAKELEKVKRAFDKAYKQSVSADSTLKISLEQTSDGETYVKAEKNMFLKEDGTLASEREIFNSLVGKTITLPEGDVKIVKRLPAKDMYNELSKRYPKNLDGVDNVKQLNSDVNQNMEELLSNSEAKSLNVPDVNGRHQKQGITSFDTRTVKFYDGDKAYDIDFSIATLQNGEKIAYAKKFYGYDDALTKKIQATETRSEKSPLNQQPAFDNSVPQNSKNASENVESLTKEQEEYFKDSKVRDENGNLKVMYHGTSNGGHTVFDPYGKAKYGLFGAGTYFTDNKSVAESYTEKGKGSNKQIYETYLNITNPMDMDAQADAEAWKKQVPEAILPKEGTNEDFYRAMEEYIEDNEFSKWEAQEMAMEVIEGMGYDGITHIGGGRFNKADETRHRVYIAFQSEQIKNVDNKKPTTNADIRYSLSEDSKGNTLNPVVQKRFVNSKAVDENGNLKVLYHGTPSGEFTIFDKSKGNVEGDFGSGFYFTDNEADVEANYEGGGPDFENKVARRAEQIEYEQEIDYDEAEKIAREELYVDAHKFQVYLNIENPAIVGETRLLEQDKYFEEYDESDFADYDEYIAEVEQLVADDIDNIVWEVERNVGIVDDTGDLREILFDAYYEGGIEIQELKKRINDKYFEDSEGELANNEVARQIIESLGYDGIIDNTVSSKFKGMGIEEGTTHYIVFKPNQIKSITNQNPTDNPDINMSLSKQGQDIAPTGNWNVYGKDIALEQAPAKETKQSGEVAEMVDEFAPITEQQANERDAMQSDRIDTLDEADMPAEVEAPIYEPTEVKNPFDERDIKDVGNRQVKAYMYENPEVKPYFQEEAQNMLYDLRNSVKGERIVDANLLYESGGEFGVWGTKRQTSEDIAYLLDNFSYTYADIEKGLNAIIEDNGKENNAVSKRIEFMLDERLREGHEDMLSGMEIPPNQDYINLLANKQITEYSDEAYNEWVKSLSSVDMMQETEDIAPTRQYEAIEPRPENLDALEKQWAKNKMSRVDTKVKGKTEEQQIAKILDVEPTTDSQRNKRKWAIFRANVFDKGTPFEDVALKHKNRELMGKWNYTLYSEARAQRLMGNGDVENGVKSLNDIREEVENTGLTKQFYEYMYHKHNVDRMNLEGRYENTENKPVFGYNVTAEMSQEIVDQYEFANPKFMDYAQDVYNYQNHLRQQLVDNGVISQETADLWQEMYPHYVPIRRVDSKGNNIDVPLDTGRTGVNAPIKKAVGGNTDILPLFDTMASRTLQTYRATAKNSFGVELKNTLGTTIEKAETNIDEVIDSVDAQEGLLQEGKNGRKPTFTVFEGGERVTFEITEDMYDALKPVSDSSMLSKTVRPLNFASNFHRGLLTEYNPVFMITNGIKDIQDVLINSQHSAKTYAKIPESFAQIIKKGYWYNEYMNNGGDQNSYFDTDTNTFKTENKGIAKLLDIPPLSTISKLNNYIETIPRLAEYIASRESGRSIEVSMLDSARVTTNFRAGGDFTKFLNRNGATFLNASVQGAMQQVRNVREAKMNGLKGWANLATKYAVAGLPVYLLNALLWEDDDEYEELSDYVKQNYYIVGKYGDGKFVRIPKGRTVSVIQDAFKQMENLATGNDEVDLKSFLNLVVTNIAPANPIESNILAPIIQVKNNKTWYGEDLVPTRLQDLPASEQFDESTDAISKWLGETFNISPVKANYLLDQYSGGVGDVLLPMLTPEAESGDNSAVGNIIAPLKSKFTTDSTMNNQSVANFYDTSEKLTTEAKKSSATDEDVLKNKYINSVKGQMNELYKQKREIQNSDLSDKEKYAKARNIQNKINALAENGLNTYEGVAIDGKYATVGNLHYRLNDDNEWQKITDKQQVKQEEVTRGLGIKPSEYWGNKEEYDYAYENPERYAIAKSVGGYETFKTYSKALSEIKADKDTYGKSISNSRKEKVANYIDGLNTGYGEKIILFKSEYTADDTYNHDIVEYLNGRSDISRFEMETILRELGFTVEADGTVRW